MIIFKTIYSILIPIWLIKEKNTNIYLLSVGHLMQVKTKS